MKEKHEQYMTHQQKEFELRIKLMQEEHDLKLKKIKTELGFLKLNSAQNNST